MEERTQMDIATGAASATATEPRDEALDGGQREAPAASPASRVPEPDASAELRPHVLGDVDHRRRTESGMRTRTRAAPRWLALVLAAAIAGFAGGALGQGDSAAPAPGTGAAAKPSESDKATVAAGDGDLSDLYEQVAPAVVQIEGTNIGPRGSGSGVIVDEEGFVLTNYHVVSNGQTMQVVLSDGRRLDAEVVGTEQRSDLALLKLADAPDDLVAATLGNSDGVKPGDAVFAIGSPFGFQGTLTTGVVSAVDRTFQGDAHTPAMRGLIQTDAAINPGNSGGPLFSGSGEVIGVTTAIESPVRGSVGVGFAVPSNQARRVLPALKRGETVRRPFLGITGDAASGGGVLVAAVTQGTSAEAAGLRPGDVILSIAGTNVSSIDALAGELDEHRVGETVLLTVRRGSRTITLRVRLQSFR